MDALKGKFLLGEVTDSALKKQDPLLGLQKSLHTAMGQAGLGSQRSDKETLLVPPRYPTLPPSECTEMATMLRLRPGKHRVDEDAIDIMHVLKRWQTFKNLSHEHQLNLAATATLLAGQDADVIAKENENADFFFIVLRGQVGLTVRATKQQAAQNAGLWGLNVLNRARVNIALDKGENITMGNKVITEDTTQADINSAAVVQAAHRMHLVSPSVSAHSSDDENENETAESKMSTAKWYNLMTDQTLARIMNQGEAFGEQCLQMKLQRGATLKLIGYCELLVVSKQCYIDVVEKEERDRSQQRDDLLLAHLPGAKDFADITFERMLHLFHRKDFGYKHKFCTAGAITKNHKYFYWLLEGQVELYNKPEAQHVKVKGANVPFAKCGPGFIIGFASCFLREREPFTVVSSTPVTVFKVNLHDLKTRVPGDTIQRLIEDRNKRLHEDNKRAVTLARTFIEAKNKMTVPDPFQIKELQDSPFLCRKQYLSQDLNSLKLVHKKLPLHTLRIHASEPTVNAEGEKKRMLDTFMRTYSVKGAQPFIAQNKSRFESTHHLSSPVFKNAALNSLMHHVDTRGRLPQFRGGPGNLDLLARRAPLVGVPDKSCYGNDGRRVVPPKFG